MKLFYFSIILFFSTFINAQSPTFNWAKSIGGSNQDESNSIAVDASGNVYTTGYFTGVADLDPGVGVYNLSTTSTNAVFVSKLDATGNFLWAKQLSGLSTVSTSMQFNPSLTLDTLGNVFVRNNDSISKISTIGNLLWTKSTGGVSSALTTDVNGNVIVTGFFQGLVDFNSSTAIDTLRASGSVGFGGNLFMLKLDVNGNFIWVKKGALLRICSCITTDVLGNIYTIINEFPSSSNLYYEKSDPSGNIIWSRFITSNGSVSGNSMCVDAVSNIYITGSFAVSADFNPYTLSTNGGGAANLDVFISKFDALGNVIWARSLGGNNQDYGKSINLDAANNIYTIGTFKGAAYYQPPVGAFLTVASSSNGNPNNQDVFIAKFGNNGNFIGAESFGGPSSDDGISMVLDAVGNMYITGNYAYTCDFDPSSATYTITSQAVSVDAFVLKLGYNVIGVQELSKNNTLIIYPNPNNGVVTIKTSSEGSYQLINTLGQTIKSFQLNTDNNFTVTIDELPQGIYTLVGKENNQTVSQKIIVIE